MKTNECCKNSRKRKLVGSWTGIFDWIIPGAIVGLIPKCPMCLAAYVGAWTGIGLSFSAATHLRLALVVLCIGLSFFLSAKSVRRVLEQSVR
jgi:hypothetical protein